MARSLNELLKLDSYQDMTDEEINLVLSYMTEQAAIRTAVQLRGEAIEQQHIERVQRYEDARKAADAAFDEVMATMPAFKVE